MFRKKFIREHPDLHFYLNLLLLENTNPRIFHQLHSLDTSHRFRILVELLNKKYGMNLDPETADIVSILNDICTHYTSEPNERSCRILENSMQPFSSPPPPPPHCYCGVFKTV